MRLSQGGGGGVEAAGVAGVDGAGERVRRAARSEGESRVKLSQGEARRERRVLLATPMFALVFPLLSKKAEGKGRVALVPFKRERKRDTPTSTKMSSNRGQWEGRVRRGRVRVVEVG